MVVYDADAPTVVADGEDISEWEAIERRADEGAAKAREKAEAGANKMQRQSMLQLADRLHDDAP